ncbi:hypothetical protein KY328_01790 [Candidatus Woesearchaeota archaeon]|nr:hypothetical protein [Candidatus Woesearchaeota archaeon]MBW3021629.1 hypothetical protein [Candidatus Woesearchaeota archaeon]
MKRVIALVLILMLVFIAGCGKKTVEQPSTPDTAPEVAPEHVPTTEPVVEETLDIGDLSEIETLNTELDFSDLDELDSALDIEI